MEGKVILILDSEEVDITDLVESVSTSENSPDIGLIQSPDAFCIEFLRDQLVSEGISSILSKELLVEKLVHPSRNVAPLIKMIATKLQGLNPESSLTIVDRFLFSPGSHSVSSYVNLFGKSISKIAPEIETINFVSNPKSYNGFDKNTYQSIINHIRSNYQNIQINYSGTDNFHDRFWIVDESEGILVGTSLNGVGKKYFLVDNLKSSDASDIVSELKSNGLI